MTDPHYRQAGRRTARLVPVALGRIILIHAHLLIATLVNLTIIGSAAAEPAGGAICGGEPIDWSTAMARSATDRLGNALTFGQARASLDYSNDLFALSLLRLADRINDDALRSYGEAIVGSFVAADGTIREVPANGFRLDAMPAGLVLLEIYRRTHDERFRAAAVTMRDRLAVLPRTDAGTFAWAPHQLWLDGLWMTEPFYARYAATFDQPADFDDILRQYRSVATHSRDPKTGLYYHGWDERRTQFWASPETGTSASFWARSIGWLAMSLVDTLDAVPVGHPAHAYLVQLINDLAPALVRYQDPASGLWWQVVDQGDRAGNYTETSASAMFVYTMAKAINRGYLSGDFTPAVARGYAGLVHDKVVRDDQGRLSLTSIVRSAGLGPPPAIWPPGTAPSRRDAMPGGRDGSFAYYVEQPITVDNLHGLGPFILAGLEVHTLPDSDAACRSRLP